MNDTIGDPPKWLAAAMLWCCVALGWEGLFSGHADRQFRSSPEDLPVLDPTIF
jgi:hypothetical protein